MPKHIESYYCELWAKAWEGVGAVGNPRPHFEQIMERMREPHRKHHTPNHVFESLDEVVRVGSLAVYFDEVVIATVEHDQVLRLERGAQNEKDSADLGDQMLRQAKVPYLPRRRIRSTVMGTKHSYFLQSSDAQLVADADLSILGKTPQRYDRYVDGIEEEFSFVPSELYRLGRIGALEQFLKKHDRTKGRFIFYKEPFRVMYEDQAVENMSREREKLLIPKPKIFIP